MRWVTGGLSEQLERSAQIVLGVEGRWIGGEAGTSATVNVAVLRMTLERRNFGAQKVRSDVQVREEFLPQTRPSKQRKDSGSSPVLPISAKSEFIHPESFSLGSFLSFFSN